MADAGQRRGGKKGRKYGRGVKHNQSIGYTDRALKKRRLVAMFKRFPDYRAPGWKFNPQTGALTEEK